MPLDPRVQLPLFARRAGGAGGEEDAALLAGAMGEWRLQAEQPGAEWWWWWAEQGEGAGADAGAPDAGATGALGGVVGGGVVRWDEVDVLLDEAARLQAEGVGAVAAGPVCTAVTEAAGVRALHQALASGGAGGGAPWGRRGVPVFGAGGGRVAAGGGGGLAERRRPLAVPGDACGAGVPR